MDKLFEVIDNRINKMLIAQKNTQIKTALVKEVSETKVVVRPTGSNADITLPNYTGSFINVGDEVKIAYAGQNPQSNNAYIVGTPHSCVVKSIDDFDVENAQDGVLYFCYGGNSGGGGGESYKLPPATTTTLGGVIPDGDSIKVDSQGKISVNFPETSDITDTGWIDIKDGFDQFSDYFEVYKTHSVARYRKMGDLVTLQIDANILSQMKYLTTALKLIRLPSECRPSGRIYCTATVTPTINAEILTGTKFVHCYIDDSSVVDVCLDLGDVDNPIDKNEGSYFNNTMIKIYISYYTN